MVDDNDELPDLDPELGALVSAYEAATARDAAQIDAALARVTANVGAAGSGGAAALSTTTKLGIVGGLAGVVAVIGVVALGPSREPASARATTTETESAVSVPTSPPVADEPPPSVTVASTSTADQQGSPVDDAAPEQGDRPSKSRASRTRPSKPLPSETADSLKAELELLRQARSALREGRAQRALEIVRQHRLEYPASGLAQERDATEVSALCALGRHDDPKAKAAGGCQ